MMEQTDKIIEILVNEGDKLFNAGKKEHSFTNNLQANELLNNYKEYPHAFVLGCIMDRQIHAKATWLIPFKFFNKLNTCEFSDLVALNEEEVIEIFKKESLHRFYNKMGKNFYFAIQKINKDYDKDASKIWDDKPQSAKIVRRFLEFEGVGQKIANMSANILARDFKIPMTDYHSIDISLDRHVIRVFKRTGLVRKDAKNEEIIYRAREIKPEYPGVLDLPCFNIGQNWCKSNVNEIKCNECLLGEYCHRIIN
ncbi:iron-sulfur cluster loop [Methanosarcina mazei]|uniref:Iron-sulfur cluster loop n=2 Tax=Methanosarcina mazei TaxID=2209 RepID=A0A0F8SY51_METMZ|nr:iron-sulfur cluster loop [Methanosarcina mazei]KKH39382.1 iron-sulfur cluster loop [Methanosarcina mazei]KKH51297.1 iron-sulfur cluster loop [Methanosarcina mazei]KKH53115.1 iron-sulfur cluster loop [Methanosarcina mazei]KKH64084.1 iron-sulfur cluster loop [Methanosarcina mazei]